LILIDDSIFAVDKTSSDNLILEKFLSKRYFFRWILYFFSIYDEKQDGIRLKQAFEVNFFLNFFYKKYLNIIFLEHFVFIHPKHAINQIASFNTNILQMWRYYERII
jgi:hypothetical protein